MCDHDVDPTNCPLPNESNGVPNCPTDISAALPYMCIYFDVNGDEGPNEEIPVSLTYEGADLSSSDVERADRGKFYVYWNGKVAVPKGQLERYLNSTSVFRER